MRSQPILVKSQKQNVTFTVVMVTYVVQAPFVLILYNVLEKKKTLCKYFEKSNSYECQRVLTGSPDLSQK